MITVTVNLLKRNIHRQGIEIGVMKFCCESEVRATRVIRITVETLFESAKGQTRKIAEIEVKGHFCPSHNVTDDVKIFAEVEYSTKMMIGVSADSRRFVKHVDSQPMVLIKQDRSKIDVPERKYPWPTRDQLVIPVLPGEEDVNDEEEYDEFEEEIVVMNVRRELIWRSWLERPKQETKTDGTLVEDLLEIPSLQGKTQDWSSEKFLIEEKIESVERQPVNDAWLTDLSSFENMFA